MMDNTKVQVKRDGTASTRLCLFLKVAGTLCMASCGAISERCSANQPRRKGSRIAEGNI